MNNIEKTLNEIYEKFYYPIYINELIAYLDEKYRKILEKGLKDNVNISKDEERDLIHNLYKEGVNYFLFTKLLKQHKEKEQSLSKAPMLLAHPNNVENKELINYIDSKYINELMQNNFTVINKSIYEDV